MYSVSQARALLVGAALSWLDRAGIVDALARNGSFPRAGDDLVSVRALAYRLAWLLLPAMSSCRADLDNSAGNPTPAGTPEVQ